MNKIPFEYGSIAENEYFIDRIEDRRDLKTFLGGGINVMLISPRRWGKSSLVKAAMEELKQEQKDIRVCYLDAFKIFSEEEFYNKFASAILQGVSSTMEKRWVDIVKFVQSISPSLTINSDPVNAVEVNLNFKPLKESAEEILNLPEKIAKEYWKPFIHDSFYNHGKSISDDMIERICNAMQCHSWYMQQFCFLIWTRTATEVTEEIYQSQLAKLLDTNSDMFITDIDGMPASQIAFLRAVCMGETHFNAQQVVAEYGLGAPRTITKNKKTLVERDFIEKSGDGFKMVDPVFELWFKREYCNILLQ